MSTNRIKGIESDQQNGAMATQKPSLRWVGMTIVLLLVASLVTGGVYYYLWKNKNQYERSRLADLPGKEEKGAVKMRPNEIPQNPELQKAVDLYRKGYLKAAQSNFLAIMESSAPDNVRSMAAVYLGIIFDDEAKFNMAIDWFMRAVRLDKNNFYAHYNMAISLRHKGLYSEAMNALETARSLRPDLIEPSILKGELEYRKEDLDSAAETLRQAAKKSNDPLAYYNLGMVYKKKGMIAEAKMAFLSALDYAPTGEIAYKAAGQLGILHATQGDLSNAKYYYERAVQLSPANPKYFYNLALVLYQMNDTEGALRRLSQAAGLGDENPETFLYIARLYDELGQSQMALSALNKAQEMAPQNPLVLTELADHQITNAQWGPAITTLKKILNTSTQTGTRKNAYYNLGRVYLAMRDISAAEESLQAAYDLDSTDEDVLVQLGEVYRKKGENYKVVNLYKEALKINPDNIKVLKALAETYNDQGLITEAAEVFRRLAEHPMKKEEDVYYAWQFLGEIARKEKRYDLALSYFEKLKKSGNADSQYFGELAYARTWIEDNRPASSVLPNIQSAIALKPDAEEARLAYARALMKVGDSDSLERAEEELTGAASWSKAPVITSGIYTMRGILFYRQGLFRRAIDDFNRALELDPSNNEAFENRRTAADRLN